MTDYAIFVYDQQCVKSETISVLPQPTEKVQKGLAIAVLFVALVAISISAILARFSECEISPYATAFHRFWITALILGGWLDIRNIRGARSSTLEKDGELQGSRALTTKPWMIWQLIAAGAFLAADLVLWTWSLTQTTVTNSTLLANITRNRSGGGDMTKNTPSQNPIIKH